MSKTRIKISSSGVLTAVYSDSLAGLLAKGESKIRRASHVEPGPDGWTADMTPVSGPVLGPFRLRAEALAAEIQYLERNLLS